VQLTLLAAGVEKPMVFKNKNLVFGFVFYGF